MLQLMSCAAQMPACQQDALSPARWRSAAAGLSYLSACATQTLPGDIIVLRNLWPGPVVSTMLVPFMVSTDLLNI
jgi:hypothetical protein